MAFICRYVGFQLLDIWIGQMCSNCAEERGRRLADTPLPQLLLYRLNLHVDRNSRPQGNSRLCKSWWPVQGYAGIRSVGGSSNRASSLPSHRAPGQTELYCRGDQFTFNHMHSGEYSISSACIRHHRNVTVTGFKQPHSHSALSFLMEDRYSHTGKHRHNQAHCSEPLPRASCWALAGF